MADDTLPTVLPIFPLTGVLLLPEMRLPLNIFEPRYRNMVADALEEGRHIGMIQPWVPRQDNSPLPEAELDAPELYPVGCAGRLEVARETSDGRYLIELRGISRFRVREELPLRRGYRRVAPDYREFEGDGKEPAAEIDLERINRAARTFADARGLPLVEDDLRKLSGVVLLNGLAAALPFAPAEKQALLEAPSLPEREAVLLSLLEMGLAGAAAEPTAPPDLN